MPRQFGAIFYGCRWRKVVPLRAPTTFLAGPPMTPGAVVGRSMMLPPMLEWFIAEIAGVDDPPLLVVTVLGT